MKRILTAALLAAATLAAGAPAFAHGWDGRASPAAWERRDAIERELVRDRAKLRHDLYLHDRFGVANWREIRRDRAEIRHDEALLQRPW